MDIKEIISNRLNELIDRKNEEDFNSSKTKQAKDMDIPYQTFIKYVKGKAECPATNIIKIAQYYNVSTDYLLGLTDEPTNNEEERAVCNYTGLDSKAVKTLHKYYSSDCFADKTFIQYISTFIKYDIGVSVFKMIDEYINSVEFCSFLEKKYPDIDFSRETQPLCLSLSGNKIKTPHIPNEDEILQDYFAEKENNQPVYLYSIQKTVNAFVEKIGKKRAENLNVENFISKHQKIKQSLEGKRTNIAFALECMKECIISTADKLHIKEIQELNNILNENKDGTNNG